MKKGIVSIGIACIFLFVKAEAHSRYWLFQEDFIKIGKKDLYEEEKKKEFSSKGFEVISAKDLENPQYVFLMPLSKGLSELENRPPIQEEGGLLSSCIHYQIFSLGQFLLECSYKAESCLADDRPYLSYVLYDVYPGLEMSFQQHLAQIVSTQSKKSSSTWNTWKILLGGDTPKYLVCVSFTSKEDLKNAKLDELFAEASIKEAIRDKKGGWMKKETTLSSSKK